MRARARLKMLETKCLQIIFRECPRGVMVKAMD